MPRARKEQAAEQGEQRKKRSRTGCWPCKARKVKCGEEKPACENCVKISETCDYSIRLNWSGRSRRDKDGSPSDAGAFTFVSSPTSSAGHSKNDGNGHEHIFSAQHLVIGPSRPPSSHPADLPTPDQTPGSDAAALDPQLRRALHLQLSLQNQPTPSPYLSHLSPSAQHLPSSERSPPTSAPSGEDLRWSPQPSAKRVKLEASGSPLSAQPSPVFALPNYPQQYENSPPSIQPPSYNINSIVNTPATPNSSLNPASPYPPSQSGTLNLHHDRPDLRRLSVKSLLSEPSEDSERALPSADAHGYRTYGYDHGLPDLDVPLNDDMNVVLPKSPDLRRASAAVSEISTSSNEPDPKQIAFEPGGYYAQPVAIRLPRRLEPLPDELLRNQMNLVYFHHFINHTGRVLVPHDCVENPFRGVLPEMAVKNRQLLHLMLAFSASHRARLLDHAEPAYRIAAWMQDVLPALRKALTDPVSPGANDPTDPSSLAPLASAIMLSSLEIVRPNTFAVSIPWQQHLQIARQMIIARGGLDHLAHKADGARDKAIFFLSRWFAYLDVLGSLSGSKRETPLYGAYLEDGGGLWLVNRESEDIFEIDCFFGFSGRCISLLAQVAELAAECDEQRINRANKSVKSDWQPTAHMRQQAEELKRRLLDSAFTVYSGCSHTDHAPRLPSSSTGTTTSATPESAASSAITSPSTAAPASTTAAPAAAATSSAEVKAARDLVQIRATNQAFHWAALINLARRVLALPSTDPEVQTNVARTLQSLNSIPRGSSAESCLLFPMFTAGCEAQAPSERAVFEERMRAAEGWGMDNVGRARQLMEIVWQTGRPWEALVDGEFFG